MYVGDNPESINRMIAVILDNLPKNFELLVASITDEKFEDIAFYAHKIKSSYRMFKLTSDVEKLQQIEDLAKKKSDISLIKEKSIVIESSNEAICEALSKIKNS